jgi:hypothetical protein
VFAVYVFLKIDPSKKTFKPKFQSLHDKVVRGVSGNEWHIVFTMNLKINILQNLKGDMTVPNTTSWIQTYDLFKEDACTKLGTNRHLISVQHQIRHRYEFTLHHPYKQLYGATSR